MSTDKLSSQTVGASLFAAIVASLCCITPVLALFSGVSGVAATFSWVEPIRPYLVGVTILVLGFAWYQKLKPKKEEIDCECEPARSADEEDGKEPFIQSKSFLGIVTVFALILLAFPSYSHIFYPDNNNKEISGASESNLKLVNMEIEGMTCTGCEEHVEYAASQLEGVFFTKASYEAGNAAITFDKSVSSLEEVIDAINETGYTVADYKVSEADPSIILPKSESIKENNN